MSEVSEKKLISIVVPAYNVENYIEKCLASINAQLYQNIEVLVVNDGSTDNTEKKIREFCEKDKRFVLLNKSNGGLSSARNYGIIHARGEYITFVDSDDYLEEHYVSDLYYALRENNESQIAMSKIRWFYEDEKIDKITSEFMSYVVNADIAMKRMMLRKGYTHCAYGKLYHISFWKNFNFPEGRLYEDYLTTYRLFSSAEKVVLIDRIGYNYLQRSNSIMHLEVSPKVLSIIEVADEVTAWVSTNVPKLKKYSQELQIANYLKIYYRIKMSQNGDYLMQVKQIEDYVNKNAMSILMLKDTPIKDRIKILLFLFNRSLFLKVYEKNTKG